MNKIYKSFYRWLLVITLAIGGLGFVNTAYAQTFDIDDEGDWGTSHASFPPSNATDGDTSWASRWAATLNNPDGANLWVDLGSAQTVDDVGVIWGRGDSRSYEFEVWARSGTSGSWTKIFDGNSSGSEAGLEQYNVDDISARQVRLKVFSNTAGSEWADVIEFEVYGTSGRSGGNNGGNTNGGDDYSGTYYIKSFAFNDYLQPKGTSTFGEVQLTGSTSNARTEWEIIAAQDDGYYYLKNSDTGFNMRPSDGDDFSNVYMAPGSYLGNWTQWSIQDLDDSIRFVNRNTGQYFRPTSSAGNNIHAVPTSYSGTWPRWVLEDVDGGTGDFDLDPNAEPWENFDLSEWKIDTPAGEDSASDCDAQTTEPYEWNSFPSRSEPYFFTHSDGGMRFVTEIGGATTGNNCASRTRSELREMLRGSNTSIDTTGDNGDYRNNWALGYQPNSHAGNSGESWGAREGTMSATLRVNKVTTTGSDSSRGRTVIGQIHADEDEPLRLNYKHRAGFTGGCIYAASEQRGGDDTTFMLVGNNTSCSQDPGSAGIALGELFSYVIENDGEDIIVTIRRGDRDGPIVNSVTIDLNDINAGYDVSNDWMYFKAGAYSQNSLGDGGSAGDGDIVTFYRLDVTH
ncbi:MAG: polysaccharide lyase family 7 protein [Acidiferrobacterales bacterium]|nr:polysaccharide lyase family 7 protein [Acidiferrobacterales bacterium]